MRAPLRPDRRLRSFFARWWQEVFSIDGRLWRSLREVVTCPGRAAARTLDDDPPSRRNDPLGPGGADPTLHPVRIYLAINLVFFLLAPAINSSQVAIWDVDFRGASRIHPAIAEAMESQRERTGAPMEVFEAVFDQKMRSQQGAFVVVLVPWLALPGFLLGRRHRPFFVEHLTFGTTLVSQFLIAVLAVGVAARTAIALAGPRAGPVLAAVVILGWTLLLGLSWIRAALRFLGVGRWRATLIGALQGVALTFGFLCYLQVLFWWTWLSVSGFRFE